MPMCHLRVVFCPAVVAIFLLLLFIGYISTSRVCNPNVVCMCKGTNTLNENVRDCIRDGRREDRKSIIR